LSEYYSRALGNIGRIYIKMKLYKEAIQVWSEKLEMINNYKKERSNVESLSEEEKDKLKIKEIEMAWLNHDIGRCYLNLEDYDKALEYGKTSLEIAQSINNLNWLLASRVLCGQTYSK